MPRLRRLNLHTFDEIIAEITRLRDQGYTPSGKWNLSQMCDHLTETMRIGIDGDEPRAPWLMRKIAGAMLSIAVWRRWMPSGLGTLPRLIPEERAEEALDRIDLCLKTLAEARDFAGPLPPYAIADGMSLEKWKRLMVVHAQHHLRFLQPNEA